MELLAVAKASDPSNLGLVVIVGIGLVVLLVWLMRKGKL